MSFYLNRGLSAGDKMGQAMDDSDSLAEYLEFESRIESLHVFRLITNVLQYLLAIPVALLAALAGTLLGAAAGYATGVVLAKLYEVVIAVPTGQWAYGHNSSGVNDFIELVVQAGASFAATVLFCVVLLRMCPHKNQILSVVVLELVALLWVFLIAGDASRIDDYRSLYVGLGCLLGLALLVIKRPHWVFLKTAPFG